MVTLVVTIEKELLKRIDANVQPNLEAEGITSKVEVEAPTKNEPGLSKLLQKRFSYSCLRWNIKIF